MSEPLWKPSAERIAKANISVFRRKLELDWGVSPPDYAALHAFSLDEMEKFWSTAWDFCRVVASKKGDRVLVDAALRGFTVARRPSTDCRPEISNTSGDPFFACQISISKP